MSAVVKLLGFLLGLPFLVVGGFAMLTGVILVGSAMIIARWLAERCELAAGPDRELNWSIFAATCGQDTSTVIPKHRYLYGDLYTNSLDAAMTLVPEGCHLQHFGDTDADNPQARRWTAAIRAREGGGVLWDGEARVWCATGPLAVCAAAMHARASVDTLPEGGDAKQGLAGTEGSAVGATSAETPKV